MLASVVRGAARRPLVCLRACGGALVAVPRASPRFSTRAAAAAALKGPEAEDPARAASTAAASTGAAASTSTEAATDSAAATDAEAEAAAAPSEKSAETLAKEQMVTAAYGDYVSYITHQRDKVRKGKFVDKESEGGNLCSSMADISAQFGLLAEASANPEAAKPAGEAAAASAVSKTITFESPTETAILMCGSNDWATVVKGGKAKPKGAVAGGDEFNSPVRMRSCLDNVRVKSLGVGPCAAHCVALTADGRVFVWGLNTSGQLGLGNGSPEVVPGPTLALLWKSHTLKAACGKTAAIKAACGKTHTLIVFEDGAMLSCGAGAKGALGYGTRKADLKEISPTPKRVLAGQVSENTHFVDAAAGCDFSLGVTADGQLYSWGWTEFGKLGLGDDGCYNTKAASIKLTYTASGAPARVRLPRDDSPEAKIVSAAAGKNHAACVCADGQGYTWGDGAYGKLGHRAQEQGVRPRLLDQVRFSVLYCGDMSTCGLGWPEYRGREFAKPANDGMLYAWGVLKGTHGEGATRPVPEYELQGWSVKPEALSMGASHVSLSADGTAIAWAQTCVASGQLGYGDKGPKSSNKPQKLSDLDGAAVCQVVAAAGTTFFLADAKCPKVKALPEYTPPEASAPPLDEDADPAAAKKGAKPGAKPAAKRAAPKAKAEPKAKAPAKRAKK